MTFLIPILDIRDSDKDLVGGKAYCLSVLKHAGLLVPDALCVTTKAYDEYVSRTGIKERIILELKRKHFDDMRWEELWDAALRIRNMFLNTPLPPEIETPLRENIARHFTGKAAAVRS